MRCRSCHGGEPPATTTPSSISLFLSLSLLGKKKPQKAKTPLRWWWCHGAVDGGDPPATAPLPFLSLMKPLLSALYLFLSTHTLSV
ncbi:hypothetical protein Hanom_Chr10g00952391 [Helianthus anomalus]